MTIFGFKSEKQLKNKLKKAHCAKDTQMLWGDFCNFVFGEQDAFMFDKTEKDWWL